MGIAAGVEKPEDAYEVSIQLISPASGNQSREKFLKMEEWLVSIQLISPASGNKKMKTVQTKSGNCFHSINIPSEWE